MYKGVIFDLDGTLIDTLRDLTTPINRVRQEYGLSPLTVKDVQYMVGNGFKVLVQKAMPNIDEDKIDGVVEKYKAYYAECYMDTSEPYEGIRDLLNELNSLGVKIAVNSNKGDAFTKNLISKIFPDNAFVAVIGQREGIPKKPDPYTNMEILGKMNLKNDEVLYVGDSQPDMKTAINSKLRAIGVSWGFRTVEELKEAGADNIVYHPEEILRIVKEG